MYRLFEGVCCKENGVGCGGGQRNGSGPAGGQKLRSFLKIDDIKSCLCVRFVYCHSREGETDGAGESGEN